MLTMLGAPAGTEDSPLMIESVKDRLMDRTNKGERGRMQRSGVRPEARFGLQIRSSSSPERVLLDASRRGYD